jgi:hypothetical protein
VPDALVRHQNAALGQDQLDVTQAQAEDVVQPYSVADDLGRKPVPGNRRRVRVSFRQPRLATVRAPTPVNLAVRRETGEELVVKVHYDEGVAIHVGPEPCVSIREGAGEASVGECAGQPLSREI